MACTLDLIFTSRGTLHLKSLKSTSVPSSFQQLPLPASNLTSLRMSAKYGGYYFIRARSKFTDLLSEQGGGGSQDDYVATFISAVSVALVARTFTVNKKKWKLSYTWNRH